MTDTNQPLTLIQKYSQELTVDLTDLEVVQRAGEFSRKLREHDLRKAEYAEISKGHKSHLEQLQTEVRRLSDACGSKQELRIIPCERHLNFAQKRVEFIRTDTHEVMDGRTMTDVEAQRKLPGLDNDDERDPDDPESSDSEPPDSNGDANDNNDPDD